MCFEIAKKKIMLRTNKEVNRIQGYISMQIGEQFFEKLGVLWDTGATHCAVDEKLFQKLQVRSDDVEKTFVNTGNGQVLREYFKSNIIMAEKKLENIIFTVAPNMKEIEGLDLIIGMNLIQKGRMLIDCIGEEKIFEFVFGNED